MPRRLALLAAVGLLAVAPAISAASPGRPSPVTDPAAITTLAAKAYVWGVAPEFVYRFAKYNELATAPVNTLKYGATAAAWNNDASNAGDASVLYLNAMIDLGGRPGARSAKELVLTIPPSRRNYFVVNLLDDFINSIGSMGSRTTPSARPQSYLLVSPTSRYAHLRTARIGRFTYRVMASDTNANWLLIRVRADALAPAGDVSSTASVGRDVVQKFALNTLAEFRANGNRPVYPASFTSTPTAAQTRRAAPWHNAPTKAVTFFAQLGASLRRNPLPTRSTGLSGTRRADLPAWVVPQAGHAPRYTVPSFGQRGVLAAFAPLGLTATGFRVPSNWGSAQREALQDGYAQGQAAVNQLLANGTAAPSTNYWSYLNSMIGTYPNNAVGYLYRASVVLSGGAANIPLDAVYAQLNTTDGTTPLDGNASYSITFTPPAPAGTPLPVAGTLPPLVTNGSGYPKGFWSLTLYQPDATESAAPFITQASVQNTAYSTADTAVLSVNAATDVMTVKASAWGPTVTSTPIMFGATAAKYGLTPGVPYYVASTPTTTRDRRTKATTYAFTVSSKWIQTLSAGGVPIQNSGAAGPIADLQAPTGAVDLTYGPIQPVSQLGSQQMTSGKLARNLDGSVTLWLAPTLPAGAPATNWIPTPSTAYFSAVYPGATVSTAIRPMIRMYYPTPGGDPPSILPYADPTTGARMKASYVFPALQPVP